MWAKMTDNVVGSGVNGGRQVENTIPKKRRLYWQKKEGRTYRKCRCVRQQERVARSEVGKAE